LKFITSIGATRASFSGGLKRRIAFFAEHEGHAVGRDHDLACTSVLRVMPT
jgi:hypothetical protein